MKLVEGGEGHKYIVIEIQGKKGYGFQMKIFVRGKEIQSEANELRVKLDEIRKNIASVAEKYS